MENSSQLRMMMYSDLIKKCESVFESCRNPEQLNVAESYCERLADYWTMQNIDNKDISDKFYEEVVQYCKYLKTQYKGSA